MENVYEITLRGLTGHNGAKTKGCQRHCLTCIAQHAEDTPRWSRQAPLADDIAFLQEEQVVYLP